MNPIRSYLPSRWMLMEHPTPEPAATLQWDPVRRSCCRGVSHGTCGSWSSTALGSIPAWLLVLRFMWIYYMGLTWTTMDHLQKGDTSIWPLQNGLSWLKMDQNWSRGFNNDSTIFNLFHPSIWINPGTNGYRWIYLDIDGYRWVCMGFPQGNHRKEKGHVQVNI